jgi:predicted hydrocarbon binding protein
MTSGDIKALENLFSYYHNAVRTTKVALPKPVDLIEEWTISFLDEKLEKGTAITINDFLKELVKKLLELTSYIDDLYDNLVIFQKGFFKVKNVAVDSRIVNELQDIDLHISDCEHIASAITHQTETKEKTVFVTLDYQSILYRRDNIRRKFNLDCCDPLYALHHLL